MDINAFAEKLETYRSAFWNASASTDFAVSPELLAGLAICESSLDQYAIRVERGFWKRYKAGIMRFVNRSESKRDNFWAKYPDIYASSYGLCQIMVQTALEAGWTMKRFPTELFDPEENVTLAAKILARHIRRYGLEKALLRYNGGGDPSYPSRVLGAANAVRSLGLWR